MDDLRAVRYQRCRRAVVFWRGPQAGAAERFPTPGQLLDRRRHEREADGLGRVLLGQYTLS